MNRLHDISNQIISLTNNIEINYPELYVFLGEQPVTIPSEIHPDMNISIMEDYLESLKQILKQYIKTRKK